MEIVNFVRKMIKKNRNMMDNREKLLIFVLENQV